MPFRTYTEFNGSTLDVMAAAYDGLVCELRIKASDPRSSELAVKIVQLVRAGEDDRDVLIKKARTAFQKEPAQL